MDDAERERIARYRRLDDAFRRGDLPALEAELGAQPECPNVVADPAMGACLTYAIYHSPVPLVRALLDAGADPNWPDADGFPPLIAALSCAQPAPGAVVRPDVHELVALLLEAGARVDQRGVNDYTPLHLAAANGDLDAVDLQAGHDIDAFDRFGQTALMRAAHAGDTDAVKWLVANGAALDHTAFGLSALMLAVVSGHQRIARVLVAAGADAAIRGTGAPGFAGKTAADLAEDRGDTRLARLLRSAG